MSEKLLQHPEALCNQLNRIAIEAGDITLEFFDDMGCEFEQKSDGSPVTLADQKAERHIEAALKNLLPSVPMIGEECAGNKDQSDIKDHEYFWLVDPLDGTKEFISGSGEYTVNIALIRNGEPWIGVVYAPYLGELYGGCTDVGAYKWNEETNIQKEIRANNPTASGLTVVASKSHGNNEKLEAFLEQFKVKKLVKRGSSLKICAIAAGRADLYPRFGPTCEWDTAAAHAVLKSAGGILVNAADYTPLTYGHNRDEKWLNPEFIASGFIFSE